MQKDKASVLSSTTEFLNSLKAEVEELTKRNQILGEQLLRQNETTNQEISDGSSTERLQVRITNIAETTSDARILDLRVILRGECSLLDLAIRVLEFLKTLGNVTVLSVEGDTRMVETTSVSQLVWRLKIEVCKLRQHMNPKLNMLSINLVLHYIFEVEEVTLLDKDHTHIYMVFDCSKKYFLKTFLCVRALFNV